jgi:hypothetical protein
MRRTHWIGLGALLLLPACAARVPDDERAGPDREAAPTPTPLDAPRLTRIEPDSVRIGGGVVPRVVLHGSGFAQSARAVMPDDTLNTVLIGRVPFGPLNATDGGTRLLVAVAPTNTEPSAGGRPRGLVPGVYAVTVRTRSGTSNSRSITLLP